MRSSIAATAAGPGAIPTEYMAYGASRCDRTPPFGSGRPSAPSRCRTSSESSGAVPSIAAASTTAAAAAASNASSIQPSPRPGTGPGGSWWSCVSARGGHGRERVDLGLEVAQRAEQLAPLRLVAEERGLDDDELPAAERLGHLRDRRDLEHAADRRDLLRRVLRPLGPGAEHLGRALDRPDEPAGVRLGDRVERDLDRGDDAEAAAAAAERPEQVRVRLGVGADDARRRRSRPRPRGRSTPRGRACARASRCRRRGSSRRRRRRGAEPWSAVSPYADGRVDDVAPRSSPAATRATRPPGSTSTPRHARRVDEQACRRAACAGAPWPVPWTRDPQPERAGVVDGRDDVVDGLGERDGGGALVDGEVPRAASLVPAGLAREDEHVRGCGGAVRGADVVSWTWWSPRACDVVHRRLAARRRRRCGSPHGPRASTGVFAR